MEILNIKMSLTSSFMKMYDLVIQFIPNILGAVILLILGLIISKFTRYIVRKTFAKIGVDKLGDKSGIHSQFIEMGLDQTLSEALSKLVYYFILLIFSISALESLKLDKLTETINLFVGYIPNIFAALAILIFGMFLSKVVKTTVYSAAERAGLSIGGTLSNLVSIFVLVVVATLAISQLQIETDLINKIVEILLVSMGIAVALSLGLGTRDIAGSVISGIYAREHFFVGKKIEIDGEVGELVSISSHYLKIKKESGEYINIPNSTVLKSKVIEK